MTTVLGCIADDFTGATDLAGLLARSGADVTLRIGVPEKPAAEIDTSSIEVIALKCRTEPRKQAVEHCRSGVRWLKVAGAKRFFWKYCSTFDSTPDGNIGPVAEMLMAETGSEQTIYCPAFPENGRRVFMGNLFVGRQLLSESSMRDHPLTPMTDSNLQRLLAPQVNGKVGLIERQTVADGPESISQAAQALADKSIRHLIIDAISDGDLTSIAQAFCNAPLITGGSALAMPLPELYREKGLLPSTDNPPLLPRTEDSSIVLSGSCSEMTRAQVNHYLPMAVSYRLDPINLAKEGLAAMHTWLDAQSPTKPKIVYATAEPDAVKRAQAALGREKAGQIVEEALAEAARHAVTQGVRRIVVAGGETSGAVTKALGATSLAVGPEIAPGVPWTTFELNGEEVALALKSGNFGKASFFEDAFAKLEA